MVTNEGRVTRRLLGDDDDDDDDEEGCRSVIELKGQRG
jgi:hypothetical protein